MTGARQPKREGERERNLFSIGERERTVFDERVKALGSGKRKAGNRR